MEEKRERLAPLEISGEDSAFSLPNLRTIVLPLFSKRQHRLAPAPRRVRRGEEASRAFAFCSIALSLLRGVRVRGKLRVQETELNFT